jgi:hypothetical protein
MISTIFRNRFFSQRIILIAILVVSVLSSANAQDQITARNLNVDNFPVVKGDLWVRNPNGIITDNVRFIESGNDKEIKPKLSAQKGAEVPKDQTKAVVFLVLNPGTDRVEYDWYKSVIKSAINSGVIKKGDKIEVLTYDRECDGQIIYPQTPSFTDDVNAIIKKVDALNKPYCGARDCSQDQYLTFQAINRTLDMLEKQNLKMPTAICVLGDDKNCTDKTSGLESAGPRALRLNIPIYAIIRPRASTPWNTIENLCNSTHGIYFKDTDAKNASAKLKMYLENMTKRNAGLLYSFEYTSSYEKDGNIHKVLIKAVGDKSSSTGEFQLSVPKRNPIEWMIDNPIWGILILLLIGGLVIGFVMWRKSEEKKRAEDLRRIEEERRQTNARHQADLEDNQKKQNELNQKLEQQRGDMEAIRRQQAEKERQEMSRKQQEAEKIANAELVSLMKAKGNFPWFDYVIPGPQSHRYEISKPKLSIGRGEGVDLRIQVPTLSKKHFTFWFTKQGEYWVKDENSSNGLYVNGVKVNQAKIKHGDFIQAGEVIFNFYI